MHITTRVSSCLILVAALFFSVAPQAAAGNAAEQVQKYLGGSLDVRKRTQEQREAWIAEKEKLKQQLETLEGRHKGLVEVNGRLNSQVSMAESRVRDLSAQKAGMEKMGAQITPYLEELFAALQSLVDGPPPFLVENRKMRLAALRCVLDDPRISVSEKYRKSMEALRAELEFGNTVEVYQAKADVQGRTVLCGMLRLGRVNLYCRTLDHAQYGFYDPAQGGFTLLPEQYHIDLAAAMDIASRRRTTTILDLPLGRMAAP